MSETTSNCPCGHQVKSAGRSYCSNSCSRKAYWQQQQQIPEQRRKWARHFKAASRKRWTPEERQRVAERQRKPEDYKRGYNTGWAACERFYRQLLQQPSREVA